MKKPESHPPMFFLLECLVTDVLEFQRSKVGAELRAAFSPKAFLKEFCTIRLATRRRAGHTFGIKLCLARFPGSVVLVPFAATKRLYTEHGVDGDRVFVVSKPSDLEKMRGQETTQIFVDCAFYMSEKTREALFDYVSYAGVVSNTCIVFVQ